MTEDPTTDTLHRARRIDRLLHRCRRDDDPAATLTDLLADARHWCDRRGHEYDRLDERAHRHDLAETRPPTDPARADW